MTEPNFNRLSSRIHPEKLKSIKAALDGFPFEALRGERILVTGSRGFLGKYLVETFLWLNEVYDTDIETIALDSFVVGKDNDWDDWRNVPNITFIKHDVQHDLDHLYGKRPNRIFHLAGIASPYWYKKLPLETIDVAVKGTRNLLELARETRAKVLFTSSSEVYSTATLVPTPETYVGAVPTFTDRSAYDISKALAETLCYIYATKFDVHATVVRVFNSVLADEWVTFCDAAGVHVMQAGEAAKTLGVGEIQELIEVQVPALNPDSGSSFSVPTSHWIGHAYARPCLEIATRYGRKIRITEDHSIFTRGDDGRAVPTEGKKIRVGDYVALAGRISVPAKDRTVVELASVLSKAWGSSHVNIEFDGLGDLLRARKKDLVEVRRAMGNGPTSLWSLRDADYERTSLGVLQGLGIEIPPEARVSFRSPGKSTSLPHKVALSDNLLWVFGLFIAEGCSVDDGHDHCILFTSDYDNICRATEVLTQEFGLHVSLTRSPSGAPTARVSSRALFEFWKHLQLLGLAKDKRIPAWILALPLSRLKFFLDGYRAGDGVYSGNNVGVRHVFSTVSEGLKNDLIVALGRFGLVPSVGRYVTNIEKRYPGRRYPFWRITISKVIPWDMLEWDSGVTQPLQAPRTGDIVWALVKSITQVEPTSKVYDFSVPGVENFVTGQGVMAHNSFGSGMVQSDRRILTQIATAAKRGELVNVYMPRQGVLPKRTYTPVANTLRGVLYAAISGEACKGISHEPSREHYLGISHEPSREHYLGISHEPSREHYLTGVYNVGSTKPELTVPELVDEIRTVTGLPVRYTFSTPPAEYETEPARRCPDVRKLEELGYRPAMTLEEGLRSFFQWTQVTYE